MNWALFSVIVLVIMIFRTSANLAGAYGIAVTTNMVITTVMLYFVMRYVWKWPPALGLAVTAFFMVIDCFFWFSNILKIQEGGWFTILVAGVIFLLMLTWYQGRQQMALKRGGSNSLQLAEFLEVIFASSPQRVEGTAVFLRAPDVSVPNALLHNLKHNKVLHRQNLFVAVCYHEVPWIQQKERLQVQALGNDCWQVDVHYGFMDKVNLPHALRPLAAQGCCLDAMQVSYFLSRDTVIVPAGARQGMARWRKKLFAQMHHAASSVATYMGLPSNAVVELGGNVEI